MLHRRLFPPPPITLSHPDAGFETLSLIDDDPGWVGCAVVIVSVLYVARHVATSASDGQAQRGVHQARGASKATSYSMVCKSKSRPGTAEDTRDLGAVQLGERGLSHVSADRQWSFSTNGRNAAGPSPDGRPSKQRLETPKKKHVLMSPYRIVQPPLACDSVPLDAKRHLVLLFWRCRSDLV
ncbi:hypothetical protein K431DRAFT_127847 [Polychaeton citri CBS 116435]|uniref:Uncharacterized protein n=1 Tax=Polychaeton citri CBS 116435 TaxID=1314669 RepID=A0A9P4UMU2_9PEZI|nr:hypothetical protein K431DRAFT_127847 [Polychaeton citri CBS 116435]